MAKKAIDVTVSPSMIDKDGKVTLVPVNGLGAPIRRWPIDAKEIAAQGIYKLVEKTKTVSEAAKEAEEADEEETEDATTEVVAPEAAKTEVEEPEFDYDIPANAPKK